MNTATILVHIINEKKEICSTLKREIPSALLPPCIYPGMTITIIDPIEDPVDIEVNAVNWTVPGLGLGGEPGGGYAIIQYLEWIKEDMELECFESYFENNGFTKIEHETIDEHSKVIDFNRRLHEKKTS